MATEKDEEMTPSPEEMIVSQKIISAAAELIGLDFTPSERDLMLENVNQNLRRYEKLREVNLDNSVPPAFRFDPRLPGNATDPPSAKTPIVLSPISPPSPPTNLEELAFSPVTHLAHLLRTQQISFAGNGLPTSITFTGRLYDEATVLAVARAYQEATDFHLRHPPLFS